MNIGKIWLKNAWRGTGRVKKSVFFSLARSGVAGFFSLMGVIKQFFLQNEKLVSLINFRRQRHRVINTLHCICIIILILLKRNMYTFLIISIF